MRQHGEKLVLHAVGVLRLDVEARVLERDRGPRADADRQAFVLLGEHAGPRVPEEQAAEDLAVDALDRERRDNSAPAGARPACRGTAGSCRSAGPW